MRLLSILILSLGLALGCGGLKQAMESMQPVPVDATHMGYVGTWVGGPVTLIISADGMLDYKRKNGATSTTLSAPIQQWGEGSLVAGVGPMTRTFIISETPHQDGGVWKMTVDGQPLTR